MSRARRLRVALAIAPTFFLAAGGCGIEPEPQSIYPDGTLIVAKREALSRLLGQLESMPGSKLSHRAGILSRRLPDCEWVEAKSNPGNNLFEAPIHCFPSDDSLASFARERGDADVIFALPAHQGERLIGTIRIADQGDVDIRLRVPDHAFADARTLIRPSGAEPGPNLLSHVNELVHARLRPEGGPRHCVAGPGRGPGE